MICCTPQWIDGTDQDCTFRVIVLFQKVLPLHTLLCDPLGTNRGPGSHRKGTYSSSNQEATFAPVIKGAGAQAPPNPGHTPVHATAAEDPLGNIMMKC